jgi:hypothetical protein
MTIPYDTGPQAVRANREPIPQPRTPSPRAPSALHDKSSLDRSRSTSRAENGTRCVTVHGREVQGGCSASAPPGTPPLRRPPAQTHPRLNRRGPGSSRRTAPVGSSGDRAGSSRAPGRGSAPGRRRLIKPPTSEINLHARSRASGVSASTNDQITRVITVRPLPLRKSAPRTAPQPSCPLSDDEASEHSPP